jgi:hypothetical protein
MSWIQNWDQGHATHGPETLRVSSHPLNFDHLGSLSDHLHDQVTTGTVAIISALPIMNLDLLSLVRLSSWNR